MCTRNRPVCLPNSHLCSTPGGHSERNRVSMLENKSKKHPQNALISKHQKHAFFLPSCVIPTTKHTLLFVMHAAYSFHEKTLFMFTINVNHPEGCLFIAFIDTDRQNIDDLTHIGLPYLRGCSHFPPVSTMHVSHPCLEKPMPFL